MKHLGRFAIWEADPCFRGEVAAHNHVSFLVNLRQSRVYLPHTYLLHSVVHSTLIMYSA